MPYPGIAVFFIGASIAAVLYYMFTSNQEEEEQRQQYQHQQHRQHNRQDSERYGRVPSTDTSEGLHIWNDLGNSRRRRGTYLTLNEAAECSICLNTVKDNKTVQLAACKHVFHEKCIKKWESQALEKKCPNCRHEFA